ncbi:MAG: rane-bound PQQ-dependent dehydrogenase, glucose/quinate/shikimate family, partial [Hyphomicrobiales bacterium]|nr:rane-bound PQQ-dependent dehydrogenase, glucose/quinate/shikimate family [Hyphomicrobiales bacterium]
RQATPMTYVSPANKRQFLVVVAGGHDSNGTNSEDSTITYAPPKAG